MKITWRYDGYNYSLEARQLRRDQLDKIVDFVEKLEKEDEL